MGKETGKGIGKQKAGLVISGIIIVVLAGLNIWFAINKRSLELQIGELWDNYGYEQWTYQNYMATHSHTNSEYDALESERNSLKAPKLSTLSLYAKDERLGTPYLHVYGEVWNVGTDNAYNSRLHVVAYQGVVRAIDTYLDLGTTYGENKFGVDSKVYYSGSALTSWSITPEWTS